MAYSSQDEVASDFKDISFTADTNVTSDDVDQFIVEADALINSYAGVRYVTPVTTGEGLNLLKMFSRNIVANRIKSIMEVKQATNKDAVQNVRSGLSTADILKQLDLIRTGDLILVGADLWGSNAGFVSSNYENDVKPQFHKDCKEW